MAGNGKADVVLVHVPRAEYRGRGIERLSIMIMPVGLLAMADALDKEGRKVEVIHMGLRRRENPRFRLSSHLRERGASLVGFALQWHHQLHDVIEEARSVRAALPHVTIVFGGIAASAMSEEIVSRFPFIDAVVSGDGERPLCMLAQGAPFESVPNLVYRQGGLVVRNPISYVASSEDLNRLDFARFDLLLDAESYDARWFQELGGRSRGAVAEKIFYMCGGRGCTVSCSFCGGSSAAHRTLSGRNGAVFRSPERLLEDARKAAAAGFTTLYLCFDPPGTPRSHYPRFFDLVRSARLDLSMIFECYRLPDPYFLDAFGGAFNRRDSQIALAPDSADERTRRRHKGYFYSNVELERCLADCARRGIRTTLYFTIFPEEGWPEVERLREFQGRLRARFSSEIVTLPIEVEPMSLWQSSPLRWGLARGPYDLDYFLRRHRRIATPPGAPDAAAGFASSERKLQFAFLAKLR